MKQLLLSSKRFPVSSPHLGMQRINLTLSISRYIKLMYLFFVTGTDTLCPRYTKNVFD